MVLLAGVADRKQHLHLRVKSRLVPRFEVRCGVEGEAVSSRSKFRGGQQVGEPPILVGDAPAGALPATARLPLERAPSLSRGLLSSGWT